MREGRMRGVGRRKTYSSESINQPVSQSVSESVSQSAGRQTTQKDR